MSQESFKNQGHPKEAGGGRGAGLRRDPVQARVHAVRDWRSAMTLSRERLVRANKNMILVLSDVPLQVETLIRGSIIARKDEWIVILIRFSFGWIHMYIKAVKNDTTEATVKVIMQFEKSR
jgi:hypothetical protein